MDEAEEEKRLKYKKKHGASYRRLQYPACGMREDIENILHEFGEMKSLRYEHFTKVWRRLNFSAIHAGCSGRRENREFIEETFKIVVKYTLFPYSLKVRVGALYLMYGIYLTQRNDPKVQIRISLSNWPDILDLHTELIESGHIDADYILRQLKDFYHAFIFVAYSSPTCREDLYEHDGNMEQEEHHQLSDDLEEANDPFFAIHREPIFNLLDGDCISLLKTVHSEYTRHKKNLKGSLKSNKKRGLEVVGDEDVVTEVIKKNCTISDRKGDSESESTDDDFDYSTIFQPLSPKITRSKSLNKESSQPTHATPVEKAVEVHSDTEVSSDDDSIVDGSYRLPKKNVTSMSKTAFKGQEGLKRKQTSAKSEANRTDTNGDGSSKRQFCIANHIISGCEGDSNDDSEKSVIEQTKSLPLFDYRYGPKGKVKKKDAKKIF